MPSKLKPVLVLAKSDLGNESATAPDALYDALYEVNGDAARLVLEPYEVVKLAQLGEERLDIAHLPQTQRPGFKMIVTSAGPGAKAYKYGAIGTRVTLERKPRGWVLVDAERIKVYPQQPQRVQYIASPAQFAEAAKRAVADLTAMQDDKLLSIEARVAA